jgi:hypothetical protein
MNNNPQQFQASSQPNKGFKALQIGILIASILGGAFATWQFLGQSAVVNAQRGQFFCSQDADGTPITAFSHAVRGDVVIIRWASEYFKESGFDPLRRCKDVSSQFQKYRDLSKLQYITTGRKNGVDIICVAEADQSPCVNDPDQGQLWTLKPGSNPNEVIAALKALRSGSGKAKVLVESQQTWVRVNDLLENNPAKTVF